MKNLCKRAILLVLCASVMAVSAVPALAADADSFDVHDCTDCNIREGTVREHGDFSGEAPTRGCGYHDESSYIYNE